jgi:hypothetical protein
MRLTPSMRREARRLRYQPVMLKGGRLRERVRGLEVTGRAAAMLHFSKLGVAGRGSWTCGHAWPVDAEVSA